MSSCGNRRRSEEPTSTWVGRGALAGGPLLGRPFTPREHVGEDLDAKEPCIVATSNGFDVHCAVRIAAGDDEGRERFAARSSWRALVTPKPPDGIARSKKAKPSADRDAAPKAAVPPPSPSSASRTRVAERSIANAVPVAGEDPTVITVKHWTAIGACKAAVCPQGSADGEG